MKTQTLQPRFEILEQDLGGTLGVFARKIGKAESEPLRYKDDETFPAASTIKVFVLQTLLEQVQGGALRLEDELTLRTEDQVTGSGILKALSPDRTYTLHDLATLMVIISDNTATNLLVGHLGIDAINAVCAQHGWTDTFLAGKLQQKDNTSMSRTSPRDLGSYFESLWTGKLLDEPLTQTAKSIYYRQHYTDQLGRDLGYDSYSTETGVSTLRIASKSGSIRGVRNDAGVVSDDGVTYTLAVMTKDCQDLRFHADNLGSRIISQVSRVTYEHYKAEA
ncbi:serine hydrolase [soil metagenome]